MARIGRIRRRRALRAFLSRVSLGRGRAVVPVKAARTAYRQSSQGSRRDSARRLWDSTRPIAGTIAAKPISTERAVSDTWPALARSGSIHLHQRIRTRRDASPRWWPVSRMPPAILGASANAISTGRARRTWTRCAHRSGASAGGGVCGILEPARPMRCLSAKASRARPPRARARLVRAAHGQRSGLRDCAPSCSRESVRRVVIAADRDTGGLRAAAALAERLEAEGRRVTIEAPPCGDFDDWQGERA